MKTAGTPEVCWPSCVAMHVQHARKAPFHAERGLFISLASSSYGFPPRVARGTQDRLHAPL